MKPNHPQEGRSQKKTRKKMPNFESRDKTKKGVIRMGRITNHWAWLHLLHQSSIWRCMLEESRRGKNTRRTNWRWGWKSTWNWNIHSTWFRNKLEPHPRDSVALLAALHISPFPKHLESHSLSHTTRSFSISQPQ